MAAAPSAMRRETSSQLRFSMTLRAALLFTR
jgi:hypothetical protein